MDFEINQAVTPCLSGTGKCTINRMPRDLLVTYDFTNGGARPVLGLNYWLLSATNPSGIPGFPTNVCLSSNSFPCWGDHSDLSSSVSEGAINAGTTTDPIAPNAPRSLPGSTFGEAAINLTAGGVFPPGTCEAFGSVFLKSRSSASFPAEVKDFVAPVPVNISNCGAVKIIKHTDPRGLDQNFSYTSTIPNTATCTTDTTPGNFTLNDAGNTSADNAANTESCVNVPAASYTVTETAAPSGYALDTTSKTATPTTAASCTSGTPAGVTFTDSPLTDLTITATSEVSGVTNSSISCVNASNADIGNSPQGPADPVNVTANG